MLWRSSLVFSMFICLAAAAMLAADEAADSAKIMRQSAAPAAVPKPALRHLLLPELKEMQPGNPIHGYLVCFMEQQHFWHNPQMVEERERHLDLPLAELPADRVRGYGGMALKQADWAARLDTPDWQLLLKAKRDGVNLLLPELQQLRLLGKGLRVRMRGEVKSGDFEAALATAKTQFALARHAAENPTLIGGLVGIAIALSAVDSLQEMTAQPGCPNLFWALMQLPQPFIDLRRPCQGERMLVNAEFSGLLDGWAPLTEAQAATCLAKAQEMFRQLGGSASPPDVAGPLRARAADQNAVAAARERLKGFGAQAADLAKMPALQVVLLDEFRRYEDVRDDIIKWAGLPYSRAEAGLQAASRRLEDRQGGILVAMTPALLKVRQAELRLDRRLALLANAEGLRHHAATKGGNWPASLTEVALPLPPDPATDRPFAYRAEGGTAILEAPAPKGADAKTHGSRLELKLAQ